jgi:hypothetical protein
MMTASMTTSVVNAFHQQGTLQKSQKRATGWQWFGFLFACCLFEHG